MERPLRSVLEYIRNFFTFPQPEGVRKRRSSIFDTPSRAKIMKMSPCFDNVSSRITPINEAYGSCLLPRKVDHSKSPSVLHMTNRKPMSALRAEEVVFVDDEDDITEVPRRFDFHSRGNHASTPYFSKVQSQKHTTSNTNCAQNGDDDIIFVKSSKTPARRQLEAKLLGFDYIKAQPVKEKSLFTIGSGSTQRGAKPKDKPVYRSPKNRSRDSLLLSDYSDQLEDKIRYKKLLEQSSGCESSSFHTPVGRIFESYNLFNSAKPTGLNKTEVKPKDTVKNRIMKVLDGLENDPVVVKDSDSEDSVIIVNPPSPKPDIQVDPINSLKKIVDSSEASKGDWLTKIVANHRQYVEDRQREIDNIRQCNKQSEELNRDINIELLRRKVSDCLQLKDLILPEIILDADSELPELTDEQLRMVDRAFRGPPNEVLAQKFNLNITRRDLMTLSGLNWLNDEVINFYMNLIIERGKNPKWPKSYAFNTFFYTKLTKDGPQSLRRWTKKVDLFCYDLICVPIHLGMHWCMAIIDFRDKSIRYYDSMGSPNTKCLEALRKYLEAEHMDKKSSVYNTKDFTLENMDDIPQQMNGSDCGMFACTFAEFITRNAKIVFSQDDMPYLRKKMVVEIMTGDLLVQ
ncbi:sentrin-specific protease 1 [Dendroctonus ponderosae]